MCMESSIHDINGNIPGATDLKELNKSCGDQSCCQEQIFPTKAGSFWYHEGLEAECQDMREAQNQDESLKLYMELTQEGKPFFKKGKGKLVLNGGFLYRVISNQNWVQTVSIALALQKVSNEDCPLQYFRRTYGYRKDPK